MEVKAGETGGKTCEAGGEAGGEGGEAGSELVKGESWEWRGWRAVNRRNTIVTDFR